MSPLAGRAAGELPRFEVGERQARRLAENDANEERDHTSRDIIAFIYDLARLDVQQGTTLLTNAQLSDSTALFACGSPHFV